mgnify:CR=1 FL=1
MSDPTHKLLETLETQFGVSRSFSSRLTPLLERCEVSGMRDAELNEVLGSIASAYSRASTAPREATEPDRSTGVLVEEFWAELRKMDESLRAVSYTHLRAHETREDLGWRRLM